MQLKVQVNVLKLTCQKVEYKSKATGQTETFLKRTLQCYTDDGDVMAISLEKQAVVPEDIKGKCEVALLAFSERDNTALAASCVKVKS